MAYSINLLRFFVQPDGWNGLIRTLIDREADMAVTSLKITPNRSQQVEFSVPFMETGIAVTVALREGAISPTAFLSTFMKQNFSGLCHLLSLLDYEIAITITVIISLSRTVAPQDSY